MISLYQKSSEESPLAPRVALCYPPSLAVTVMPPLGIGYLASAAERAGFQTDLFDLSRRHVRPRTFAARLRAGGYDVVGISVSTPNLQGALRLARLVREALPRAALVIGGAHPSAFVEPSLREFRADYLVQREGELSLPDLLSALARGEDPVGKVPGVFALRNGVVTGLPADRFVEDLDTLSWPAWEKLEPHRYPPTPHQLFVRRLPVAPILTSRGCPMDCSFCASAYLFGRRVRTRGAQDVVEELRFLVRRFGIREFHFEDDNLTLARDHAVRLLEAIARADLGVLFKCPNGLMTMTLDDELLALMARAGCYQISLGIETTSAPGQAREPKILPYDDVRRVVVAARRHGLEVQGLFIVGLPYETPADVRRTVRDAVRLGLDLAHFGVFVPLPGSRQGEHLAGCDIETMNFFTPHVGYPHISPRTLKALQRWAILRFYLRPRPLRLLWSMFKPRQVFGVLNVARRYLLGI